MTVQQLPNRLEAAVHLSGFSDEIADDLTQQCNVMRELGSSHLEFRSAWGSNVVDLGPVKIDVAAGVLEDAGLSVSCIGSPVGKWGAEDDIEDQLTKLRAAIGAAERFGTRYIRIFSFFIPAGRPAEDMRSTVLNRMEQLVRLAEREGMVLLHENEIGTYGDVPKRCLDLVRTFDSPHLRAAIDPGNFVLVGVKPFDEGFHLLDDYVDYLQVKDARANGGTVLAGQGDGQISKIIAALAARGYDGFLSLEPHLGHATGFGGYTGPAGFRDAWRALTDILDKEQVDYS